MNANNELLRAAKDAVYQGLADDDGLLEGEPLRARLINLRAAIAAAESAPHPDLLRAAKALLRYAERNECSHEETHRGGAIWTICDDCGRKWADDEGGFKPYQEPKEIAEARAAIAAAEQAQPSEPAPVDFAAQVAEMTSKFRNWRECEAGEIDGQEHEVAIDYNAMLHQLWVLHDLAKQRKGGAS